MPYKVKELVFRLEFRSPTELALRLEENKELGQNLGKEAILDYGRTNNGETEEIEESALDVLLAALRREPQS